MMRRLMGVLMGFVLMGAVSGMQATVYHVRAVGSDAANGNDATPWQTLKKANGTVVAGDAVMVHAGQYTDGISPTHSGQSGRG